MKQAVERAAHCCRRKCGIGERKSKKLWLDCEAQDLVWQVIDDAPEPPHTTVPVGATPTIVPYDANAAAASVVAEVKASPLPQETAPVKSEKKRLVERSACEIQPVGYGPVSNPDTSAAFLSDTDLSSAANNAATPSGYFNTFKNLQGSSSAYGYMGYTTLTSYDTQACASKCDAINGCVAFNIYFERDPSVEPADACPNPASTNVIKCVFWGGPVYENTATNRGQWRNQFEVVIAGSNGYVAQRADDQAGYSSAVYLGDNSINAPLDCAGYDTFLGSKIFTDGPFDPKLCAAACTAQSEYNVAHPPANAPAQTCQFFNTFFVLKNGVPEGQYCSLYSKSWDNSYAVNNGQWRGSDHYTISYSFSYTNATDAGKPRIPCAVASASSAIVTSSLQPYCSSLLGYTTPVTTATETDFTTIPATTVVSTVTPLTTSYSTTTQLVAVTKHLKRDLPPRPTTTCLHDDPTPLDHSIKVRRGLWARDEPLVNGTKDDDGNFVDVVALPDVTPSNTTTLRKARRDGTPAGLSGFSADVVSSACSLLATPYALSDDATHMTDNWYKQGSRETFIVAADGSLYSVTHNAYYYIDTSSTYSLLYWSNNKSSAMKIFSYTTLANGNSQVFMKSNGKAYQFCIRQASKVGDGNTGSGQHIYAFSGATAPLSYCTIIDLIIIPA
ncbi:uncharacterized protein CLUP02_04755 [Colletotrichum lupini]|uniref:Apple domain-containing protein n=1 Tax=Colletotrichum lupini TaxID=145971 RepID=A0A9Q8SKX8_9PEZI|nr:uncharacterized protein CLUP02_04755 [Colletotrichum lupini]UQC79276.1 hypothetical protein CLUP02_04755 [Colletotrichum lupini]